MSKTNDPPTAQEWSQLTRWQRKRPYLLFVWCLTQTKIEKFFMSWTLPNFAIRQIRKAQGGPITVNEEATEQTDMNETEMNEWKRLYNRSTPAERLESFVLMLAIIEARQKPTAASPDEERHVKPMSEESGLCEACGKRQGETNSRYIFHSPMSDPDCGDWVCLECEQEAEQDHNEELR